MKLEARSKKLINACVIAFLGWAVAGILLNSKQLDSVTVTLRPGATEHKDRTILIVGKNDEAADYQLKVRSQNAWIDLGTYANRPIGDGLTFLPSDSYPTRTIQEVLLLDHDKLESDTLEQGPLEDGKYQGSNYEFSIQSSFSLQAGFHWFFATPVGIAILGGIGIAIFLTVLSNLNF
ncbi:hypothetical protein QEH56_23015 [Pelagicoccus enzymogenes]|uniref:hypothetical protein n=1 Tax=Pelagicoccus enzymogenes TaxID=2773457 RepID=UPI00280DE93C|nr:hypothetical protein [Pelagicoccus enzymogenes]MDQ8201056.1 hypothetical protein [Pelagicoccus enzymogenes]